MAPPAHRSVEKASVSSETIEALFEAGVHYGYSKSRRHPSTLPYIYGNKDGVEIIDLEKTFALLERAKRFAREVGAEGGTMLFVSSKNEARDLVKKYAEVVGQPYVAGRWIGGTLTNFQNIRKRVKKLHELEEKRESGELEKYTNKEQILFEREIERLDGKFGGIRDMEDKPDAMFIIDPKEESIAVAEAKQFDIPVIALANTDCNVDEIQYPILANDASRESIDIFTKEITGAFQDGQKHATDNKKDKQSENEEA